RGSNIVLDSNEIFDWYYYGLETYYMDEVIATNNYVHTNSNAYYPFYIGYGNNSHVEGNVIDVIGSSSMYPMRIYYCDETDVIGNKITAVNTGTNYGLYYYYCDAPTTNRNLVANNMVSVSTSGTAYSSYFYNCSNTDYIYNSLNVVSSGATSNGAYI